MRKLYRVLAVISSLAGIGSFFVATVALVAVNPNQDTGAAPSTTDRQSKPADPRLTAADRRDRLRDICNRKVYEATAKRLRAGDIHIEPIERLRPLWLGADPNFDYFYDFAKDEVFCDWRAKRGQPAVAGSGANFGPPGQGLVVTACLTVILVCGALLLLVQALRRPGAKD